MLFFLKKKKLTTYIVQRIQVLGTNAQILYAELSSFPCKSGKKSDLSLVCRSVGGDYGVIQMTSLFCHKWQTCSSSTQDFLGQAHFTLGEVVGSLGSRSEKALGWVGVSAAWILISNYQNHCRGPEPVQHVSGIMLQMQKVAVWEKTMNWGSQTCKSTTTLCSPGWLDSLPPAATQRRAADSKQLPVGVAMWSSLFRINFSVLWIWSHMRQFSFLLTESSLLFKNLLNTQLRLSWRMQWNPILRCPMSKPTSFILIYLENDAASSETLYVNQINSNPAIVCNECETHSWLLMMSIK